MGRESRHRKKKQQLAAMSSPCVPRGAHQLPWAWETKSPRVYCIEGCEGVYVRDDSPIFGMKLTPLRSVWAFLPTLRQARMLVEVELDEALTAYMVDRDVCTCQT